MDLCYYEAELRELSKEFETDADVLVGGTMAYHQGMPNTATLVRIEPGRGWVTGHHNPIFNKPHYYVMTRVGVDIEDAVLHADRDRGRENYYAYPPDKRRASRLRHRRGTSKP